MTIFRAKVDSLAHGGALVAQVLDGPSAGMRCFVRGVVPGEEIELRIISTRGSYSEAVCERIITPSVERVSPPCPYFGSCGGCDLQQMTIAAQRRAKLEMVRGTLLRQGKLAPREGVKLLGEELPPLGYRGRVTLHLDPQGNLGFYRPKSGIVVPIQRCLLASEAINLGIAKLQPLVAQLAPYTGAVHLEEHEDAVAIVLKIRERHTLPAALSEQIRQLFPHSKIEQGNQPVASKGAEEELEYLGHFAQVNRHGNELLKNVVTNLLHGEGSVTELYAGAGNFSFALASAGCKVHAVEVDPALVARAKAIARAQQLESLVRFSESSAERFVRKHPLEGAVLLDPPRSGALEVARSIRPDHVHRIVYVSCSLPTLTRDVAELSARGFCLQSVGVIDMFSQTHHVETVSVLTVNQGPG